MINSMHYLIITTALATTLGTMNVYAGGDGQDNKKPVAKHTFTSDSIRHQFFFNIENTHKKLSTLLKSIDITNFTIDEARNIVQMLCTQKIYSDLIKPSALLEICPPVHEAPHETTISMPPWVPAYLIAAVPTFMVLAWKYELANNVTYPNNVKRRVLEIIENIKGIPLMVAVSRGNETLVDTLIKAGANVNHLTSDGQTPLMVAVSRSDGTLVNMLINAGANANQINKDGNTALSIASPKMLDSITEAREAMKVPEGPATYITDGDLPAMLALAVASERRGHQRIVPWLLKLDSQSDDNKAEKCSICMEKFAVLVSKKAELRPTSRACMHLMCDICEQQKLRAAAAPDDDRNRGIFLGNNPLGEPMWMMPGHIDHNRCGVCKADKGPAFQATADQKKTFKRVKQLFVATQEEEEEEEEEESEKSTQVRQRLEEADEELAQAIRIENLNQLIDERLAQAIQNEDLNQLIEEVD